MRQYLLGTSKGILLVLGITLLMLAVFLRYIFPAPPHHIRIAASKPGSYYHDVALKYKAELSKEGVTLELVNTRGAFENLQFLQEGKVELALTHGGLTNPESSPRLVSLGSISYEPIWVFRRKGTPDFNDISQVKGLRVNIGQDGTGLQVLTRQLLKASGVNESNTTLSALTTEDSIEQLTSGRLDIGFFMDPPENPKIQALFKSADILEVSLKDAEALRRNFRYLHVINLPPSVIDLEEEQPVKDFQTVAATNTLVANEELHGAIQYLLLSVMDKVHHAPTLINEENEFPSDKDVDLTLGKEAGFFYDKGMPFLNQYLHFELASIVERLVKALIPIVLLIFPMVNSVPAVIEWHIKRKFTKLYKQLIEVEKLLRVKGSKFTSHDFEKMINAIESDLVKEKIPLSFSNDVYILREHIELARRQIARYQSPGSDA